MLISRKLINNPTKALGPRALHTRRATCRGESRSGARDPRARTRTRMMMRTTTTSRAPRAARSSRCAASATRRGESSPASLDAAGPRSASAIEAGEPLIKKGRMRPRGDSRRDDVDGDLADVEDVSQIEVKAVAVGDRVDGGREIWRRRLRSRWEVRSALLEGAPRRRGRGPELPQKPFTKDGSPVAAPARAPTDDDDDEPRPPAPPRTFALPSLPADACELRRVGDARLAALCAPRPPRGARSGVHGLDAEQIGKLIDDSPVKPSRERPSGPSARNSRRAPRSTAAPPARPVPLEDECVICQKSTLEADDTPMQDVLLCDVCEGDVHLACTSFIETILSATRAPHRGRRGVGADGRLAAAAMPCTAPPDRPPAPWRGRRRRRRGSASRAVFRSGGARRPPPSTCPQTAARRAPACRGRASPAVDAGRRRRLRLGPDDGGDPEAPCRRTGRRATGRADGARRRLASGPRARGKKGLGERPRRSRTTAGVPRDDDEAPALAAPRLASTGAAARGLKRRPCSPLRRRLP